MSPMALVVGCWQTPIGISVAAHPAIVSPRIMYRFMDEPSNVRVLGSAPNFWIKFSFT
jgi:hypothetical protein